MNSLLRQIPRLHPEAGAQRVDGRLLAASPDDFIHLFEDGSGQPSPVGERIVELCDGNRTVGQIIDALCAEFEVDAATCAQDTTTFISLLCERKLLIFEGGASGDGVALGSV
jgi:pyrroloquinoline quinone biosynthesis protein D